MDLAEGSFAEIGVAKQAKREASEAFLPSQTRGYNTKVLRLGADGAATGTAAGIAGAAEGTGRRQ